MKTIVLVGCGKTKLSHAAPAKDLYTGPLFKKARAYAERVGDAWRILSARYCLLNPERVIEPYEATLPQKKKELHWWKLNVRNSISCDLLDWTHDPGGVNFRCTPTRFIALAGEPYLCWWDLEDNSNMRRFCTLERPLEGMGIGQRLQFLTQGEGICRQTLLFPGEESASRTSAARS